MQLGMMASLGVGAWERMVRRVTQGGSRMRGLQRARGGSNLASRAWSAMHRQFGDRAEKNEVKKL